MIDRYTIWNASGNVSQHDLNMRDEIYTVSAPITARGYADLADAVQTPNPDKSVIEACSLAVAGEIAAASHIHDQATIQERLTKSVRKAVEQRNYR